jgi:hypothetical protein
VRPSENTREELEGYKAVAKWNILLDPAEFVRTGREPDLGYQPLGQPPASAVVTTAAHVQQLTGIIMTPKNKYRSLVTGGAGFIGLT